MREILFRGKDKRDGEWVEGYLVKYRPSASEDKWIVGIVPAYASALYIIEVIPKTVGQYTGLTDKNGKKIFEGDIVKDVTIPIQYGIGVIQFGNYKMQVDKSLIDDDYSYHIGFYVKWNKTVECFRKDLAFWNEKVEMFGNIHDNPEMLEEK